MELQIDLTALQWLQNVAVDTVVPDHRVTVTGLMVDYCIARSGSTVKTDGFVAYEGPVQILAGIVERCLVLASCTAVIAERRNS